MKYYSQFGQDKFIHDIIHQPLGTYIDIGAYDGITNRNTLFFEKLGWSGILVEPNSSVFAELKKNRGSLNAFVNKAVSNESGISTFVNIDGYCRQLSGLKSKYHNSHWHRASTEVVSHKCEIKETMVDCITFSDLIRSSNVQYCDLLSIDTEGAEIDILKSIDWENFRCKVLCVENPYGANLLSILPCNFKFVKRLECDDIFEWVN